MKRLGLVALLCAALAAGFAGSYIEGRMNNAEPVEAQQRRQDDAVRIALVNLEECARRSKRFAILKEDWERRQDAVKERSENLKTKYERIRDEIRTARLEDRSKDEILPLQVELKALEESMKVAEEEDQKYLSSLLNQYQKDVLERVVDKVVEYTKLKGYDIVLQDYTVDSGDAAFFQGSAYAQAVLSTPVVFAPGLADNSNGYVTDITEAIIQR